MQRSGHDDRGDPAAHTTLSCTPSFVIDKPTLEALSARSANFPPAVTPAGVTLRVDVANPDINLRVVSGVAEPCLNCRAQSAVGICSSRMGATRMGGR